MLPKLPPKFFWWHSGKAFEEGGSRVGSNVVDWSMGLLHAEIHIMKYILPTVFICYFSNAILLIAQLWLFWPSKWDSAHNCFCYCRLVRKVEEREAVIFLVILNMVFVGVRIWTVKSLPNQLR